MKLTRLCSILSLVAALGVLLYVALSRIGYPFELEWMESMTLRTVQWLDLGRTIYPAPSMEFVAYPYTPLYFYTSYLAAEILGFGFAPMRLVSLLASLISFWYLYRLLLLRLDINVARFGTAFYIASFGLSGYWFDVARVDAMFISLAIIGSYQFLRHTRPAYLFAALLFALAAFTKQTALLIALPLCVYGLVKYRAKSLWFSVPLGVMTLSAIAIYHVATEGWFTYYAFGFMRNQLYKTGYVAHLLWHDLAKPLPIVFLFTCLGAWLLKKKQVRLPHTDLVVLSIAAIAAAIYVDMHMASYKNDLMPMHFGLAILFASLTQTLKAALPKHAAWITIAATLQVLTLLWGSQYQIPTAADLAAGKALRARLASAQNIWIPNQAYNFDQERTARYSHLLPASDMIYHDRTTKKESYISELQQQLPLIDTLILETIPGNGPDRSISMDNRITGPIIRRHFELVDSLFGAGDLSLYPVTGDPRRPQYIYVRR